MIDRERPDDSKRIPSGNRIQEVGTIESQAGSSTAPPAYYSDFSTPLHRRLLVGIVGTAALAIWIFAWSIVGIVEGRVKAKIIFSVATFLSAATLAYRTPVLVAFLFKTPYEAAQKADKYLFERRALLFQYIFTLLWANLTCWPAVGMSFTQQVNWLNIAVTVLCANMTILHLMTYITARKIVPEHVFCR